MKNIAGTLLGIARHHVKAPDHQITFLKNIKSRMAVSSGNMEFGMSEKSVIRLEQFDDWHNVVRLIALPEELLVRAKDNRDSRRSALDVMYAAGMLFCWPAQCGLAISRVLIWNVTSRPVVRA